MLLIIIDDLPHETLWRLWAEQYDTDSAEIGESSNSSNVDSNANLKRSSNSIESEVTSEQPSNGVSADITPIPSSTPLIPSSLTEEIPDASAVKASFSPVKFLIHAKYPDRVKSGWVRDRLVSFHLKPGWGSLELTEVMIKMLGEVTKLCMSQSNPDLYGLGYICLDKSKTL